jgi:hypothetical protein
MTRPTAELPFRIQRAFGWGVLMLSDRGTQLIPEASADSSISSTDEAVAVSVRHAQDVNIAFDDIDRYARVPLAEVEVNLSIGPVTQAETDFDQTMSVPSGFLAVGDADHEDVVEVGPGRWRVQVACTPSEHADRVDVWLSRPEDTRAARMIHRNPVA